MPLIAAVCGLLGLITGVLAFVALFVPLPFLGFTSRGRAAFIWAASVFIVFASWVLMVMA